ncbi:hypothetical protein NQ315_001211 [Exocentrus adspersus]|uniref:UDENN FLCN/SMCR8-type domain-containing protein n=1 Tax=Exocentrus adspersus TaxID=1586481 RepID=A0AAV8WG25_9CUCU|nr:hypothetical protein NQ315_001211 [Exocentrus adspersus]
MEVVIAMGHFCEIHGPCVVMCTDRAQELPETPPVSLDVPVCDACESVDLDTVYTCQDEKSYYVTTRTSLSDSMARLLREAVTRSLSVEVVTQEDKDEGTMYFGDNTKGHYISHLFTIKDSLSRGFKRKYCIVVRGQHQVPLMHHYDFIEKNLKQISGGAGGKSQPCIRSGGTLKRKAKKGRCYPETSEPFVFAHLHLWFVFLLRAEVYQTVPHKVPECPVECSSPERLRDLYKEMPQHVFRIVLYCILTGIKIDTENKEVVSHFQQLLPKDFVLPTTGTVCRLYRTEDGAWNVQFKGTLPKTLPRMFELVEEALANSKLPDSTLQYYLMSISMRWFNIACVVSWSTGPCDQLMRSLGVHKCDMPLLSYWIPQSNACVKFAETDWFSREEDEDSKPQTP